MKKITIGITTYNRLDILKAMARSFYASKRNVPYAIRIYDDDSADYSVDTLWDIFPDATSIIRNNVRLGSDQNIASMYRDFLKHDEDVLFNADSDLIFNKEWLNLGMGLFEKTEGVLSLFNTSSHKTLAIFDDICEKKDLGSAGTLISRENVEKIFNYRKKLDTGKLFDWQWSNIFRENGIKLYASRNSLVQHIGISGYNSFWGNVDYGTGFKVSSVEDGQVINDMLAVACSEKKIYRKGYSLFPFELIPKDSRIIIYGAGRVGFDYLQQMKHSNYVNVVGVVDINPDEKKNVMSVRMLNELDFDYIVLATKIDLIAESMKETLKEMFGDKYKQKLIEKKDKEEITLLSYE